MVYQSDHQSDHHEKHEAKRLPHSVARTSMAAALTVALAVPCVAVPMASYADDAQDQSAVRQANASTGGAAGESAGGSANGAVGEASADASVQDDVALQLADVEGSAEKQEIIYATLASNGGAKDAYVVNVLEGEAGKTVEDFGAYSTVVNLTDTSQIAQTSDSVIFTMPEGGFTYQGTMPNATIPWNISIEYKLDGQTIASEDLAGKSGAFELHIATTANMAVDPSYFDNYLMQITCTLPMEVAQNVKTDQGSIALAGSDTTVSFMVMPGSDGSVSLSADVQNFEMDSMSFAAIPFSMALDLPDTNSLVSQFDALVDGADQISEGAKNISDGVGSVDDATQQVAAGAAEVSAGVAQMNQGLQQYQQELQTSAADNEEAADMAAAQVEAAQAQLTQTQTSYVVAVAEAYRIAAASGQSTDPNDWIKAALQSDEVQQAGATYKKAMENFTAATGGHIAATTAAETLNQVASGLGSADDAQSLIGGMAALEGGAESLAEGANQLAGGTQQLAEGAQQLTDGTITFAQETQGIPDAVQAEIDNVMSSYDKSDFTPTSFTSSKNTNVKLVQFVLSTDPIKVQEPEAAEEPEQEQTLLDRFLALFS